MTRSEVMQRLLDAMAREIDPSKMEAYARAYATLYHCEPTPSWKKPAVLDSGAALRDA